MEILILGLEPIANKVSGPARKLLATSFVVNTPAKIRNSSMEPVRSGSGKEYPLAQPKP